MSFAILSSISLAQLGEEGRWFSLELVDGKQMVAQVFSEEDDSYVVSLGGKVFSVAKTAVRKIEPASSDVTGEGNDPRNEKLRAAIEAMAKEDNGEVLRAYSLLLEEFPASRPFIHRALGHSSSRVRALALKLLGERGAVAEDLKAVTVKLSDDTPSVRLAAVMAVRSIGREGLPELVTYLREERVANNLKMAIKTFQVWKDQRAIAPLVVLLRDQPDSGVRSFIACALHTLTGQDFGQDAGAWASYLTEEMLHKDARRLLEIGSELSSPPETSAEDGSRKE
jgi:hypothetical protein